MGTERTTEQTIWHCFKNFDNEAPVFGRKIRRKLSYYKLFRILKLQQGFEK